jgi:hypothetical protein
LDRAALQRIVERIHFPMTGNHSWPVWRDPGCRGKAAKFTGLPYPAATGCTEPDMCPLRKGRTSRPVYSK